MQTSSKRELNLVCQLDRQALYKLLYCVSTSHTALSTDKIFIALGLQINVKWRDPQLVDDLPGH